jgi:hypothetical protein
MNEQSLTATVEPETGRPSSSLVERMDASIGEATTMMGAVMSELLRRTLRGGVAQIGDQLHTYVAEKVDATIVDRTPAIEQAAVEVAEHTARIAATEIAVEEVKGLEQRTREMDRELASQIELTARAGQEATAQTARDLATRIEETEKRVSEAAHNELTERLEDLMQRSREGNVALRARLKEIGDAIATLGEQLRGEELKREAEQSAARTAVNSLRLEHAQAVEKSHAQLSGALEEQRQINQGLSARLAELERPRGLRALLLRLRRLFSRRARVPATDVLPPGEQQQAANEELPA